MRPRDDPVETFGSDPRFVTCSLESVVPETSGPETRAILAEHDQVTKAHAQLLLA